MASVDLLNEAVSTAGPLRVELMNEHGCAHKTHYVEHGLQSATRSGEPCPEPLLRREVARRLMGRAVLVRSPASRWFPGTNGTSVDALLSSYPEIIQSPVREPTTDDRATTTGVAGGGREHCEK